jgi:hypothetical protein
MTQALRAADLIEEQDLAKINTGLMPATRRLPGHEERVNLLCRADALTLRIPK